MEIERKFLVEQLPDISKFATRRIEQGYVSISPEIRIMKNLLTRQFVCGYRNDRDTNASLNIKKEGLRLLTVG